MARGTISQGARGRRAARMSSGLPGSGRTGRATRAARARGRADAAAARRRRAPATRRRGCAARARRRRAPRARPRPPRGRPRRRASAARRRPPPRAAVRRGRRAAQARAAPRRRGPGSGARPPAAADRSARPRARPPACPPAYSALALRGPGQRVDGGAPLLVLLHVRLEDPLVQLQRVAQLELQLAAAVAQLGDAALDPLRLLDGGLHEPVGRDLGLPDEELGLALRVVEDLVRDALGPQQGLLQLALAVFGPAPPALHPLALLLPALGLAHDLGQLLPDEIEELLDLGRVVAAPDPAEAHLADGERGERHGASSLAPGGSGVASQRLRKRRSEERRVGQ